MIILETSGFFLTVLLVGANRNSNGFSIVRVGESPERLLLNSAVLGYLESGIDTLHEMEDKQMPPPDVLDQYVSYF